MVGAILTWVLFLPPWLMLLFLEKERVRRYMSVGFLTLAIATFYFQIADYFDWWDINPIIPFLVSMPSFTYGFLPVMSILVFYYTFPNLWLFLVGNLVIDAFQAYVVSPYFFVPVGLYRMVHMGNTGLFLVIISYLPIIYLYQLWYDRGRYDLHDVVRLPNWQLIKRKVKAK